MLVKAPGFTIIAILTLAPGAMSVDLMVALRCE
jgi:hypothetical protein